MSDYSNPRGWRVYGLVVAVTLAAALLLLGEEWTPLGTFPSRYWNALGAFAVLGIVSDSFFLWLPVAKVNTSVVFIPLLAAVLLLPHPWPMVVSGLTAFVVDSLVRKKPAIKVWFNTAQYMLTAGLGELVYTRLGGTVSLDEFSFAVVPFVALVACFYVANHGSVAVAVSLSESLPLREAWERIVSGSVITDLLSSTLAVLLAVLYVKMQFVGLAILIFPLFLVRQLYQMNFQLQQELEEKLELMVKAMEARDPYTSGHSRRVSEYAVAIARELRLSANELDAVKRAALLHDVGKIYEEFAPLLRKDGKLTPEEMMVMRTHVVRSSQLVSTAARLRGAVEAMIRHHHENFDGSGYPDGLSGTQIPIGARIIMIADTLDAMTTDRPYRRALTLSQAIGELEKYAGSQFDPMLVRVVAKSETIRRLLGAERRPAVDLLSSARTPPRSWAERVAR
jgi:putative nucleotidyltransferase with HDIG domain